MKEIPTMSLPKRDDVTGSRQVSWWAVHEFVAAVLDQANGYPMAGTPAWCSLAHDDPMKLAAVLDAGQRYALRIETEQQARAEASRDVAASTDWPALARSVVQGRGSAYIPRVKAS
jgi:hypothetical protein